MATLKEKLEDFPFSWNDENKLTEEFAQLAPYFLYGGYIRVLNRYRIYIQRVEFYFHSEMKDGVKDEIVYHRNHHHVAGILPYYKPITFHAHASGFDIAFENSDQFYRASALIRAYEIYDEEKEDFMVFVHKYETMRDIKKGEDVKVDKGRFEYAQTMENLKSVLNTQSTYLYDILNGFNGFSSENTVYWRDEALSQLNSYDSKKMNDVRQGVYKGTKWQDDDKQNFQKQRDRKWGFYRKVLNNSDII